MSTSDSSEEVYSVERVVDKRVVKGNPDTIEYLLKWRGYGVECNTWEAQEHVYCPELVSEFEARQVELHKTWDRHISAASQSTQSTASQSTQSTAAVGFARGLEPDMILGVAKRNDGTLR